MATSTTSNPVQTTTGTPAAFTTTGTPAAFTTTGTPAAFTTTRGPVGTTTRGPMAAPKPKLSGSQKLALAGLSALLFFILNHPLVYKLVNGISNAVFGRINLIASPSGCPTPFGVAVHALVFMLLCRGIMQIPMKNLNKDHPDYEMDEREKWSVCIVNALLFIIIAMPWTFAVVNRLFNGTNPSIRTIISSPEGCATLFGLLVHSLVYFGLDRALMEVN